MGRESRKSADQDQAARVCGRLGPRVPIPVVLGTRKTRSSGVLTRTGATGGGTQGERAAASPAPGATSRQQHSALTVRTDAFQGGHCQPGQRAPQHHGPPQDNVIAARRHTRAYRRTARLRNRQPHPTSAHRHYATLAGPTYSVLYPHGRGRKAVSPPLVRPRRPTGVGKRTRLGRVGVAYCCVTFRPRPFSPTFLSRPAYGVTAYPISALNLFSNVCFSWLLLCHKSCQEVAKLSLRTQIQFPALTLCGPITYTHMLIPVHTDTTLNLLFIR